MSGRTMGSEGLGEMAMEVGRAEASGQAILDHWVTVWLWRKGLVLKIESIDG